MDKDSDILTIPDLSEMLSFALYYDSIGAKSLQLNTEHAIEILTRLLELEMDK